MTARALFGEDGRVLGHMVQINRGWSYVVRRPDGRIAAGTATTEEQAEQQARAAVPAAERSKT
ncbi:MAG: hypothetical protein HY825_13445 [Acidobacteria bacterium]|nr:hypothetical protein [Acidobacteriota bacterium]